LILKKKRIDISGRTQVKIGTIFAEAAAATAAAICCFWALAKIWTILWCVAGSVCLVLTAGYGLSFDPID
jgi:hypothetical protein